MLLPANRDGKDNLEVFVAVIIIIIILLYFIPFIAAS